MFYRIITTETNSGIFNNMFGIEFGKISKYHKDFTDHDCFIFYIKSYSWLPFPKMSWEGKREFYFTEEGFKRFKKTTLKYSKLLFGNNLKIIKKRKLIGFIEYCDEFQVAIKSL